MLSNDREALAYMPGFFIVKNHSEYKHEEDKHLHYLQKDAF